MAKETHRHPRPGLVLDVDRRLELGLEILEFVVHGEECVVIARKAAA